MSKILQVLADPTLVNFLKMKKFSVQKKLQLWDLSPVHLDLESLD